MTTRFIIIVLTVYIAAIPFGCECGGNLWQRDAGVDSGNDADRETPVDGDFPCEHPCGATCCGESEVCVAGECQGSSGPCSDNDDCSDDHCCADIGCVPWGSDACGSHDPECSQSLATGLFQPALQCAWTGPPEGDAYPSHVQVLGSPVVADFDFAADPDSVHPSIVFNSYDGLDGGSGAETALSGVVRVIDGRTCEQQFSLGPHTNGCNPPALGDLDGDGRADIVLYMSDNAIEAFSYDPLSEGFVRLWESHDAAGTRQAVSRGYYSWTGPALVDLDDDGVPEVVAEGTVIDSTGLVLDTSAAATSAFSVVADLDLDGQVEMATGSALYTWDLAARTWIREIEGVGPGYVAVADFGRFPVDGSGDERSTLDGIAEIAVVHSGSVRVDNIVGRTVFGPVALPASSGGGPPTIGDFDGDGLPEMAAAGSDSYTIFDPDCVTEPDLERCPSGRSDGILWTQPSQDHSSNITGSSIFDFEGDGRAEAVYADEIFVRVYDGESGEVVYSTYRTSCTWNENPIVADVDGDFNAELVVPSNENCGTAPASMGGTAYETDALGRILDPLFPGLRCGANEECVSGVCDTGLCRCEADDECSGDGSGIDGFVCTPPPPGTPGGGGSTCRSAWLGSIHGVRVYRDVADRWVSSRTIWNQHAYAVTNVHGDGTVPRTAEIEPNWTVPGLNNFRQNVQGEVPPGIAPDLTSRLGDDPSCGPDGAMTLSVMVCNRGAAPVGAGLPVTFYLGDPAACLSIPGCTVETDSILDPGMCTAVSCLWTEPATEPVQVIVVADDDGACSAAIGERECWEGNNTARLDDVACLGPG